MITTVLGEITEDKLGITSSHDNKCLLKSNIWREYLCNYH